VSLAWLSRLFNWRDALVVVRPETLIRLHRAGWRLFWHLKSRPGHPPDPAGAAPVDPAHGERESTLGRGADRQRIAADAGPAGLPADRAPVHAETTAASHTW